MKRTAQLILIGLLLVGLGGCTEAQRQRAAEAVEQSAAVLAQVQERLDQAESLVPQLREQIAQYRELAGTVGGERVAGLVEAAEARLAQVQDALPALRGAVAQAETGVEAAEQALAMAERGANWWEYLSLAAGVIGALFGGAGVRQAGRGKRALASAVGLADRLRPLSEAHDAPGVQAAIRQAKAEQSGAGVRELVDRQRAGSLR